MPIGAVLLALAGLVPAAEVAVLVLAPDGSVRSWSPGDATLRPATVSEGRVVNDLAPIGDGRWLLLLRRPDPGESRSSRRGKHDGEALLVGAAGGGAPTRLSFSGEGLKAATHEEGTAWILALERPPGGRDGSGQAWIHQIDLKLGQVAASTALDGPGLSLVADPGGRRLFVGDDGRIRSLTSHPLAGSWHYRSPGANRALAFRPGGSVLYAARAREIAVFDPATILGLDEAARRDREDDATAVILLPFAARELRFSADGRLVAALGAGTDLAIVDLETRTLIGIEPPPAARTAAELRLLAPAAGGSIPLACFPSEAVTALAIPAPPPVIPPPPVPVAPPPPPPVAAAPAAETIAAPAGEPGPAAETIAPPAAEPAPAANPPVVAGSPPVVLAPSPAPEPSSAAPATAPAAGADGGGMVLSGSITGEVRRVEAIVVYGPGSIIREAARVVPGAGGRWEVRLPVPGVYRVVPLGTGARPLGATPAFHTAGPGEAAPGLDFTIPAAP